MSLDTKVQWLREHGFNEDHLAILVEDQKCQAANRINSKGMSSQVQYLLTCFDWKDLVSSVQNERKLLASYGMKSQSKVLPEKNVKAATTLVVRKKH